MIRTTKVNSLKVTASTFSSVIQIGDSTHAKPLTRAIAVQQVGGIKAEEPFDYPNYRIFQLPQLVSFPEPNLTMKTINHRNQIVANNITLTALAASSILHLGNSKHINAEARIKHIRILQNAPTANNSIV